LVGRTVEAAIAMFDISTGHAPVAGFVEDEITGARQALATVSTASVAIGLDLIASNAL